MPRAPGNSRGPCAFRDPAATPAPEVVSADGHRHASATADFLARREEEKERERAERARLREEERAARETAAATETLRKERDQYATALALLRAKGDEAGAAELEAKLSEIDDGLAGLAERAANTRAGHVYVISNVGAFGERMVKVGMTRRLEPMDRVRELGDASVRSATTCTPCSSPRTPSGSRPRSITASRTDGSTTRYPSRRRGRDRPWACTRPSRRRCCRRGL